jgi:heme a synthase
LDKGAIMSFVAPAPVPLFGQEISKFKPVKIWLYTLAMLVFCMVMVGGATRLTGSGLSITEWRPFMGAIPPLSHETWILEFEKYRQISQYQLLNKGMSLSEFQFIYWWEWGHRQLGRLLGFVFALPFIAFVISGHLRGRLLWLCLGLGFLGGLQALIGWIMVASGLKPGMVAVAPVKLMLHLTLASIIFAGLIALASRLGKPLVRSVSKGYLYRNRVLIGLIFVQIALGALVAGSKAGLSYNTWPLMDGALIPSQQILFAVTPLIENFVDNPALVQFNHRLMAYLLIAFAFSHMIMTRKYSPQTPQAAQASWLAFILLMQGLLGIITLLLAVPLWAGLIHQAAAFAVLGYAITRPYSSPTGSVEFSTVRLTS